MLNLLTQAHSRQKIFDLLPQGELLPYLPPSEDPYWKKIIGNPELPGLFSRVTALALEEATRPLPPLGDDLYSEFGRTGARAGFERPYFERRRVLGRAAFALIGANPEDVGVLRDSFLSKIEGIFSEESWAVPAHVALPGGKDPFCIDLFSSDTAWTMAACLNVFGDILPEDFRAKIRGRLRLQFFENYLKRADEFAWTKMTNNWNAVCHQGVIGSALLLGEERGFLADLLFAASSRLSRFLDGFTPDGGCSEGISYWSYGFGWFCRLNEQLERQTGGGLSVIAGNPLIGRIARFAPALSLAKGQSVKFADGGGGPVNIWTLGYIGARLGEKSCLAQARENRRFAANFPPDIRMLCNEPDGWKRLFTPICRDAEETPSETPDVSLPELGVWVARGKDKYGHFWELAAKAGHNEEHHNHNDVGSFILHIDGVALITEIGQPQYVRDFFRAETRYRFLAARSLGHSLPLINGHEQANGIEYRGNLLLADTGADPACFAADIGGAYPVAASCRSAVRKLVFHKREGSVALDDEIELSAPGTMESALIAPARTAQILAWDLALIESRGIRLELRLDGDSYWDRVEELPYVTHGGKPASIARLVMRPAKGITRSARFRCTFSIAGDEKDAPGLSF